MLGLPTTVAFEVKSQAAAPQEHSDRRANSQRQETLDSLFRSACIDISHQDADPMIQARKNIRR